MQIWLIRITLILLRVVIVYYLPRVKKCIVTGIVISVIKDFTDRGKYTILSEKRKRS